MRQHPLDVGDFSNDDSCGCVSKGHHDPAAFLSAARECWGGDLSGWGDPRHIWLRAVPGRGGYRSYYIPAKAGARGAFPATVMEEFPVTQPAVIG